MLFFAPNGSYLGKHRKIMPTGSERLVWGFGDGSTIPVFDTPLGKVGAVICWENYLPLMRAAMYAKGIEIYCTPTADCQDSWTASMRHIAVEGRCLVLSCDQFNRRRDFPGDYDSVYGIDPEAVVTRGGSCIVDPFGNFLAGPNTDDEVILTAEIDRGQIIRGKYDLDVVGHYARRTRSGSRGAWADRAKQRHPPCHRCRRTGRWHSLPWLARLNAQARLLTDTGMRMDPQVSEYIRWGCGEPEPGAPCRKRNCAVGRARDEGGSHTLGSQIDRLRTGGKRAPEFGRSADPQGGGEMTLVIAAIWPQPLDPLHSTVLSALVAALPLILILVLMGGLRKGGLFASACGLGTAGLLAMLIWRMPLALLLWSTAYGFIYALWPVLWIVVSGLWLYNLTQDTGKFELLRRWMEEHVSGDACIQAILVAFCFGALLEGSAGFGAPVAVTACLLAGLGFEPRRAVIVALIANTAPVAFGGLGIPIVALAGVTGLDLSQLSAMVGRQVPFLSFILPAYLVWVAAGGKGLKRTWPAALVAGGAFALAQFLVSNLWGPYAADVVSASASIAALVAFLRVWAPGGGNQRLSRDESPVSPAVSRTATLSSRQSFAAWLPWGMLCAVVILWSYLKLLQKGQVAIPIPSPLRSGCLEPSFVFRLACKL